MNDVPASPAAQPIRVGYVMTHYPRLAQTFIAGEIDGVTRAGITVHPFAMNAPDDREAAIEGAAARIARTTYLKADAARAVAALGRLAARHPLGTARIAARAVASAGGSPRRAARRLAHMAQAARLAVAARTEGLVYFHAHFGLAPATIAWLASELTTLDGKRVPFGFTIHGFHDFVDPAESALAVKAQAAAHVLCISDFTRAQLCLVTPPELWDRFHVARCGIDTARLAFTPRARGDGDTVIVAIGRLSAEKGFAVLIDAVARLHAHGTRVRLRLVGDGPERAALEAAASRAGVSEIVSFLGELPPDAVRGALADADIFALPSFSEGLPVSIMEAMAVGVPVVTTWIAGIPELAVDGDTAMTVAPGRADTLADAIGRIADDRVLAAQLAERARARVVEQHDADACAQVVAERIRAVIA